ncbi:nudix hydrolase 2-like isoform X2 [Magnolia sinica]|uniref:nudix hydrolase 2-like isoform X2 n=1 Tax=Magnolia sinica TaxID=86752 RepID=UPI00265A5A36|nr:nudix hydrolase 2-like isoform X2 [Magnolia sinica]
MLFRSLSRLSILCFKTRSPCISANLSFFGSLPYSELEISWFLKKSRFLSLPLLFTAPKGFRVRAVTFAIMSMSTSASPVAVPDKGEAVQLLIGVDDAYGGVTVDMKIAMDPATFLSSLRASLLQWKQQGKKGVWIKLPIELVNLVQPAVEEGFWYHHAEPNYLMLAYWIPDTVHTLPINATHRVGIGAFVMNDKGEVLVVQENSGHFRGTDVWKFPTGVIDEGEDIAAGAVREVKEETGIDTEFVEILAFRQSHKAFFGKSDIFFVCMLRPLSFDIQRQELEIEAAQWMPFEEYSAQPIVQKYELLKNIADICLVKASKKGYAGFLPVSVKSGFPGQQSHSYLYLNSRDLNHLSSSGNEP